MKKIIGTFINGLLFASMTTVSNVKARDHGYWFILGLCALIAINSALTLRND